MGGDQGLTGAALAGLLEAQGFDFFTGVPCSMIEGLIATLETQYAAVAALDEGEAFVAEMVAEYDRRRRLIVEGFRAIGLPTFEPRGAFYAFPEVTVTGMDSISFSERLLAEERVAVVPGSAFGACGEGFVRACYASSFEQIERALERIGRFVQRNRQD